MIEALEAIGTVIGILILIGIGSGLGRRKK